MNDFKLRNLDILFQVVILEENDTGFIQSSLVKATFYDNTKIIRILPCLYDNRAKE